MKTLSAVLGLIAGVAVLAPLVVVGGLIALAALPAFGVARHTRSVREARRHEPTATVLALGPAQAEARLDALGQRAA